MCADLLSFLPHVIGQDVRLHLCVHTKQKGEEGGETNWSERKTTARASLLCFKNNSSFESKIKISYGNTYTNYLH